MRIKTLALRPSMRPVLKALEGKNMHMRLPQRTTTKETWPSFPYDVGHGSHGAFEGLRQSMSSYMSLPWFNSMVEGG